MTPPTDLTCPLCGGKLLLVGETPIATVYLCEACKVKHLR